MKAAVRTLFCAAPSGVSKLRTPAISFQFWSPAKRLLHPRFALLASITKQDLTRHVAILKAENRILREAGRGHGTGAQ